MTRIDVINDYFDWLYYLVCADKYAREASYEDLLRHLYRIHFTYLIPRDQNRAKDGINLRYRFTIARYGEAHLEYVMNTLDGPCSVLEMMIALAIRCEETIMDDPDFGDRTGQWFWGMVVNLGLGGMTDANFDVDIIDEIVLRFLNRDYSPDGRGGLFTIRDCNQDLREVEIWYQLCWYLDSIT